MNMRKRKRERDNGHDNFRGIILRETRLRLMQPLRARRARERCRFRANSRIESKSLRETTTPVHPILTVANHARHVHRYSLSKRGDRTRTRARARFQSARGDLRTNVPFYFRHVPNQSRLLCCRGKCLFQVKQTDTPGPSSYLFSSRRAPSISSSE